MTSLDPPLSHDEISTALRRIDGVAIRTPLVRHDDSIYLKMECLQPYGSYKIRGAANVIAARLEAGVAFDRVVTASAGNFGQALTAAAIAAGKPVTIHIPEGAARVKVDALLQLGADIKEHAFDTWWRIMQTRDAGEDAEALFLHPVCEREVVAGAGTIGVEILHDLPQPDVLLAPVGGGGLITGVGDVLKAAYPHCQVIGVECETAAPLTAAFAAGEPVTVTREKSFIDGMGSTRVLDAMWPRLRRIVDNTIVLSLDEVAEAVRTLARDRHVVAEGAGAAALAAARRFPGRNVVAIVSGGNIDPSILAQILNGRTP